MMGDRKKKIRRVLRGLLKECGLEALVSFSSREGNFELKVHGVPEAVLFSLDRFINERIDKYEACGYEDLKNRMVVLNKEIILMQVIGNKNIHEILRQIPWTFSHMRSKSRQQVGVGRIIEIVNAEAMRDQMAKLFSEQVP